MLVCGLPGAAEFTRERQMALKEHEADMSFPGVTRRTTGGRLA